MKILRHSPLLPRNISLDGSAHDGGLPPCSFSNHLFVHTRTTCLAPPPPPVEGSESARLFSMTTPAYCPSDAYVQQLTAHQVHLQGYIFASLANHADAEDVLQRTNL